mgnify:CR=1 FL=1
MSETRHPILADTSALIAVAMSDYWTTAEATLKLTTTNICRTELQRHVRENHEYAQAGTREHRLHHGSKRVLEAFDGNEAAFSTATVVPAPSGEDAGERSIETEIEQHGSAYQIVCINDAAARNRLQERQQQTGVSYRVVPPTYLLYVLLDTGELTKGEFCRGCAAMMRGENWTTKGAVHEMWRAIPVDCSEYVDDDLLP